MKIFSNILLIYSLVLLIGCTKTTTFLDTVNVPVVITQSVDITSQVTVESTGNVTSSGGSAITQRGMCWNIKHNATIDDNRYTNDGAGEGIFISSISGLLPNTRYFVRAYATNILGTSYGNEISFKTP